MKSKLVVLVAAWFFLPIAGIGLAHAQNDETLRVNVPFAFYAGTRVMPAGTYAIGIDTEGKVLTIADGVGGI